MIMFRKTLTIKVTSLAATIFLAAPVLSLVLWGFVWHMFSATGASYQSMLFFFNGIQMAVFSFLSVCAVILSLCAVLKKGKRIDNWDRKEDVLLCALSITVAVFYLFTLL